MEERFGRTRPWWLAGLASLVLAACRATPVVIPASLPESWEHRVVRVEHVSASSIVRTLDELLREAQLAAEAAWFRSGSCVLTPPWRLQRRPPEPSVRFWAADSADLVWVIAPALDMPGIADIVRLLDSPGPATQ